MPSIRQAAAMAGVPALQLVRWNHRHQVTENRGGFGMTMSDTDVARLLKLSELIARGVPEAEAAEQARAMTFADPTNVLPHFTSDLVRSAKSMDVAHLDTVLNTRPPAGTLATQVDEWLMPELRRVGEAWVRGDLTPAQEDFASSGVLAALYARYREMPDAPAGAPTVVIGLAPGELHEIPLLATALVLRERGLNVDYLGANVSVQRWERAVVDSDAVAAVLAARTPGAAAATTDVTTMVKRVAPDCLVWVGATYAHRVRHARVAPSLISEATQEIADAAFGATVSETA
ncbi:hypothetical protein [Mariniluteicoccus flavus]